LKKLGGLVTLVGTQFFGGMCVVSAQSFGATSLPTATANTVTDTWRTIVLEHFDEYKKLTLARDWAGIFKLNNTMIDPFGTKKELRVLGDYLEDGEVVFALVSGVMSQTDTSNSFDFGANTWVAALTNERVLFLDHAMLSRSVDTQSVRHDQIQAVSASQGWVLGKVIIDIGSRSIVIDNCQKAHVPVFAKLANKWLKESKDTINSNSSSDDSPVAQLERLANLKASAILDDEEFAAAKAKILARM
jgi:hypothetical protein